MHLLLFAVALQRDDLHAVLQRRRHRVEHVRGADEEHLRQIERHVEIVIAERIVLFRIEGFEQRRGRIAAEVASELVDLVEHDHRVVGFRPANALDDLARQRTDIGAPMAADLGLVVHAAQGDALELAAEGAGDRAAQRGLAHARRSDKAEDRALHVGLEFEHAEVVEDAILDLLQLVVILVEDLFGLADVDLLAGALRPRKHGKPLDVVACQAIVGGHGGHAAEAIQFLHRLFLHVLGHAGGFDLLAQIVDLALAFVLLAQLLLNGLHLLAQIVVALRLLHLVLHFALDLGAQLLDFDLLGEVLVELLETRDDRRRVEQLLLVVGGQKRQRRGNEVDQPAGILDVGGNGPQFVGEGRRFGDDLLELVDDVAHQRFDAGVGFGLDILKLLDLGDHEGLGLDVAQQLDPADAFGEDEAALVGHAHHFVHGGQGADLVHVVGLGRIEPGIELRGNDDRALLAQRLDELDGALAADRQRQHSMGKQHGIADGEDRNPASVQMVRLTDFGGKNGWLAWH